MADPATATAEKARRKALYEKNKPRYLALSKRWREQNPERVKFNDRNKGLKRNYGISEHDYQKMHATQNGPSPAQQGQVATTLDQLTSGGGVGALLRFKL